MLDGEEPKTYEEMVERFKESERRYEMCLNAEKEQQYVQK